MRPYRRGMADRGRHSLLLMASLRWLGGPEVRVRVCDISRGGAKVRAAPFNPVGAAVGIELPNIGWITATVMWTTEQQFGIRFAQEIEPDAVRQPVTGSYGKSPVLTLSALRYVA